MWQKLKELAAEKLGPIVQKMIKPFLWIAGKMTSDPKKAADIAPILLSITVLSVTLAMTYMFTCLDLFRGGTAQVAVGLQAGCGELSESKNKNNNNILTENYSCAELLGDLIPEGDQVTDETCQTIYEQAIDQFDAQTAKGEALASYFTETEHFSLNGEVLSHQAVEAGEESTRGALEAMQLLTQKSRALMGSSNLGMLTDPNQSLSKAMSDEGKAWIKDAIKNSSEYASAAGEELGGDYKEALPLLSFIEETTGKATDITAEGLLDYQQIKDSVRTTVIGVIEGGKDAIRPMKDLVQDASAQITNRNMGEVPFKEAKETRLDESQVKRLKKLAGIV
jgi:hypothetical protein